MSMVYVLVATDKLVLTDYSSFDGNFRQVAIQVLDKVNMSKAFGQFVTTNYSFYIYVKETNVFLVMVQSAYETSIAIRFLKKIQELFFENYDAVQRNQAAPQALKDFQPVLETWVKKYSNVEEVDKLSKLKKELKQLQEKFEQKKLMKENSLKKEES